MRFQPRSQLPSSLTLPGDKSISHRVLLMASLATGPSRFSNLSTCEDVETTKDILRHLGVRIVQDAESVTIYGGRWQKPTSPLNCGNSGTTARHILGLLASCDFDSQVVGDESLSRRPMKRVVEPLNQAGANIELSAAGTLPATITAASLRDFQFDLKIASGQIKSSLILAAAKSNVNLKLTGRLEGRDHTERLIPFFGGVIQSSKSEIMLPQQSEWKGVAYKIPSDPSAAAFWIAAALLARRELLIKNVSLNPTRRGFIDVLKKCGAQIEFGIEHESPEPVGWVKVAPSQLRGFMVSDTPTLIDEVPLLALLATQASGVTRIVGASELRVKESNRLQTTFEALSNLGLKLELLDDGFEIPGGQKIQGGRIESRLDHRIAMLGAIASYASQMPIEVLETECIGISDPYFLSHFSGVAI